MRKKIAVLFVGISILIILYPLIANYLYEHRMKSVVKTYEKQIQKETNDQLTKKMEEARDYNKLLSANENKNNADDKKYWTLLNQDEEGLMGVIEIPSIKVTLPIYHGTEDAVLEKGIGHLQGTSLPIGGMKSHSVLTGHTGIVESKLFTDLINLKIGDWFYIHMFGEVLQYQVYDIEIVLPQDSEWFKIEDSKDLCTLITCTPYGVNSHRLLVHGERILEEQQENTVNNNEKELHSESQWTKEYIKCLCVILCCLLGAMISKKIFDLGRRKIR